MKRPAQLASGLALGATLLTPLFFFAGWMNLSDVKTWMLAATFVWFLATPFWMERKPGK